MTQKPTYEELEQRVHDLTQQMRFNGHLRESEEKCRTILESIEEAYFEVDLEGNLTSFNDSTCEILGYSREELQDMNNRDYMTPETATEIFSLFNHTYRTGNPIRKYGYEIVRKDGSHGFHELFASLVRDENGGPIGFRGIAHDITERKLAEMEREELIERLQAALAEVKTLKGIFPICASCKQIRDDKGYWNQIENYLRDHTEAEFSHGLCPECVKKLYPDMAFRNKDR